MAHPTPSDPHEAFCRGVHAKHWCAKAYVWARGWEDPAPIFVITFRNGVEFTGKDKDAVIANARVYHDTTFNLTGEYP